MRKRQIKEKSVKVNKIVAKRRLQVGSGWPGCLLPVQRLPPPLLLPLPLPLAYTHVFITTKRGAVRQTKPRSDSPLPVILN